MSASPYIIRQQLPINLLFIIYSEPRLGATSLYECLPPITVHLDRAVMATTKHVFQRLRPITQLPAIAEIKTIASTTNAISITSFAVLRSSPHVIRPRMLSVIRDQGPCDLWGMFTTRDWRLLTSGSKGIS